MFRTFPKQKIALLAAIMLMIGAIAIILAWPGAAARGFGLLASAWQTAFGDFSRDEIAIETPLPPSSTFLGDIGQKPSKVTTAPTFPLLIEQTKLPKPVATSAKVAAVPEKPAAKIVTPVPAVATNTASSVAAPTGSSGTEWCSFSRTERGAFGVLLNEVAWMGSAQGSSDEWLELANVSDRTIGTGGWQILNNSGSIKIDLGADSVMFGKSFRVFRRAAADYSGALNNSGDRLKIFDDECKIVDELNALDDWPAGDNTAKKTLERDANSSGWHTSADVGGTPGAQNSIPIASAAAATSTASSTPPMTSPVVTTTAATTTPALSHLVIAAIKITGGEGATDQDYIKIFNPTPENADVSGWKLRKRTQSGTESSVKVFPDGSIIAPGGYFIWANSADGFAATIGANVSSTQTLAADNSIALLNADGAIVDALAWGSGHTDPYVEGSAYPENSGTGQELARKFETGFIVDTDDNSKDFELNP